MCISMYRNDVGKGVLLVAGIMLATNWPLLGWANRIMSEMLFWALTATALFAYDFFRRHYRWKSKSFLILVVALAAAYYTRGVAIALVGGVLLSLFVKREWKAGFLLVLGFGLLIAPWSIRNAIHGLPGRYMHSVMVDNPWNLDSGNLTTSEAWVKKLKTNAYDTTIRGFVEVSLPGVPFPKESTMINWMIGSLFLLFCVWGISQWNGLNWAVGGYLGASVVIFLLWHSGNGARYVWPLAPVIMIAFISGVSDLGHRILSRVGASSQWVPFMLLVMLFWSKSSFDQVHKRQTAPLSVGQLQYISLSDTLNHMAEPNARVVVRKPEITRSIAPVHGIRYPYTSDSLALLEFLVDKDPAFILIDNGAGFSQTAKFLVPFLNAHKEIWTAVVTKSKDNNSSYLLRYHADKGEELLESWRTVKSADEVRPNP